ncbi:MAG: hypothetical protein H0W48_00515 [Methylibium sp.]|nr:hypothetical protein [Methylibium sp.]
MTWTDPTAVISQLRTQLVACAGWAAGESAVHYPDIEGMAAASYPLAILAESSRTAEAFAAGLDALSGGTLQVVIYGTGSIGTVEELGRTILGQLLAQHAGFVFRASECGLSSDPSPAQVAGGSAYRSVTLTLSWGLSV